MLDSSKCYKNQKEFDDARDNGEIGNVAPRPRCDGNGNYEPTVCIPGQTCFCVNEEGERIFGDAIESDATDIEMKCECSRMVNYARGIIEQQHPIMTARCDSKGSYDVLQCMNNHCFCSDPTGDLSSERRNISEGISSLPCCEYAL